jgi:hypothetical protein
LAVATEGAYGAGIDVAATLLSPLILATTAVPLLVVPALFWGLFHAAGGLRDVLGVRSF